MKSRGILLASSKITRMASRGHRLQGVVEDSWSMTQGQGLHSTGILSSYSWDNRTSRSSTEGCYYGIMYCKNKELGATWSLWLPYRVEKPA